MNKKWILILIVFSLASFTLAIPQTFNINGKLTDTTNSPLSGTYTFNFSIYSNSTGGTHLWTINGSGNITTLGRGNFTFTNSDPGTPGTPGLAVGNRTNGFIAIGSTGWYDDGTYFSPSGTRHFYIRSSVPTT